MFTLCTKAKRVFRTLRRERALLVSLGALDPHKNTVFVLLFRVIVDQRKRRRSTAGLRKPWQKSLIWLQSLYAFVLDSYMINYAFPPFSAPSSFIIVRAFSHQRTLFPSISVHKLQLNRMYWFHFIHSAKYLPVAAPGACQGFLAIFRWQFSYWSTTSSGRCNHLSFSPFNHTIFTVIYRVPRILLPIEFLTIYLHVLIIFHQCVHLSYSLGSCC